MTAFGYFSDLNIRTEQIRQLLRVKYTGVHLHDPSLMSFVDCSNIKFGEPALFSAIIFFASLQVMPGSTPPVMFEQLRVMLEPGSTVMEAVC